MRGARRFVCPDCERELNEWNGRFPNHADATAVTPCPMAGRKVPDSIVAAARMERRADEVLEMAARLRDENPTPIRSALTNARRDVLEEWAFVALAAINVDEPASSIFAWVYALDKTGAHA